MKIAKLIAAIILLGVFISINIHGGWFDKSLDSGLYLLIAIIIAVWGTVSNKSEFNADETPKGWDFLFLAPLCVLVLLDFYFRGLGDRNFGEALVRLGAVWVVGGLFAVFVWKLKKKLSASRDSDL